MKTYYDLLEVPHGAAADVIADFHIANFLNDPALAPYGYTLAARQGFPVVSSRTYDGTAAQSSNVNTLEVNDGAVQYFTWENVAHLNVTTDVIVSTLLRDSQKKTMRERIRSIVEATGRIRIVGDVSVVASLRPIMLRQSNATEDGFRE